MPLVAIPFSVKRYIERVTQKRILKDLVIILIPGRNIFHSRLHLFTRLFYFSLFSYGHIYSVIGSYFDRHV